MATTYDRRTGEANKPGVTKDYSGIKDQSLLKYDEQSGKPITSGSLTPSTPMVLPNAVISSDTNSASDLITRTTEENKVAAAKTAKDTALKDVNDASLKIAGQSQRQDDIFVQEGGDKARKDFDEYTSQIESEQLAIRRTTDALRKNNPEGLGVGALNNRIQEVERKSLSKQADLAILQNSALRRYDTASAIAARKVAAETDYLKAELETKKLIYQDNKEAFTLAEQRMVDAALKKEEREYNEIVKTKTDINNVLLEAAKNNAPKSVIDKISAATTQAGAIAAAGSWMSDPLDRAIKNAQLAALKAPKAKDAPTIKTINGVDMEWDGTKWVAPKTDSVVNKESVDKSLTQLKFLKNTAAGITGDKEIYGASGRSGSRKFLEGLFVGATDYTALESKANTLKVNVLSLMTDPTIKKFFGPQMSNADVTLMTSAGTTLNPELQNPQAMYDETVRLEDLFNRMEKSILDNTQEYKYIESIGPVIEVNGTALSPNSYAQSLLQQ